MDSRALQTSHAVGTEYLQSHSRDQRRSAGQVYTPPHIVGFVLGEAGYRADLPLADKPLLDPACGAGAFLEQAIAILLGRFRRQGFEVATVRGHRRFLEYVEQRIWAVDADERSCAISRDVVRGAVEYLTSRRPSDGFLRSNIIATDFLVGAGVGSLPPVRDGTLGLVVGNPPYVSTGRLSSAYKAQLRQRFASAKGRLDLYTLFVERALELLANAGRLALITPDKFLTSHSARELRAHVLRQSAVRSISTFDSHKVFDGVDTVPCVTVLEKGAIPDAIVVRECVSRPDQARVQILKKRVIGHFSAGQEEWQVASHMTRKLMDRVQGGLKTLRDVTIRISAGPATGRDNIFVFPAEVGPDVEPELLKPAIRGRDIDSYRLRNPGLSLLCPYLFDASGSAKLIRLRDFQRAARYLESHKAELTARHCVRTWGKSWYEFHDSAVMDIARKPKILVPDVAVTNRFAVDEGGYFPLHSAYYIVAKPGVDLHFLVAVLNSPITAFLMRARSPKVKDGFQRYRQQFLRPLPIPDATDTQVRSIARLSREGRSCETDELVCRLFGLTEKESASIRSSGAA